MLPDGPLHELPFAALRVPGDPKRYLAEWKPVHVASSFSLYAALRGRRQRSPATRLVAFRDPSYPGDAVQATDTSLDPVLRREIHRGRLFESLPASRREVEAISLAGLTQAFLAAGARSVLASLWSVSDESTELLMAEFYRNLKRGDSKDRALQEAQVAMIRRGARPFHWAAFQLTGDWR